MKTKARLLGILACLVFLVSIFTPFLQAVWQGGIIPEISPGPETYWSFKGTIEYRYLGHSRTTHEYWLIDYWFLDRISQHEGLGQWTPPTLILTLTTQILVLLSATTAILLDKRNLLLASTILNTITLSLMILVAYELHHEYDKHPVTGFWLTLLAATLFTAAYSTSRKP